MLIDQRTIAPSQTAFDMLMTIRSRASVPTDIERLREAYAFADSHYGNTMHWTKETVMDHCLGILRTLLQFEPDDDTIIACLLHHTIDAGACTLAELERRYGTAVRNMISGENLLSHATVKNRRMSLEQLRLMFLKVSGDARLILLLLSQQYHLLERLDAMSSEDRKRICRDTLQIYSPVAARLGIYTLKHQMEARAFPVMYPVDATHIAEQLENMHAKHGQFLQLASTLLMKDLALAGILARVQIREKQPYSIFHKMQLKSLSQVEDLYDLFALRVIVSDESECYQALGVLHRLGHPVAGRFKDYIAFPKPNGYKSLHTTLAQLPGVPEGVFIEVQIRTVAMQREAEYGIAAHWSYKEGGTAEHALQRAQIQRALTQPIGDNPALDSTNSRIFVLTPHGDVIQLPEGATPLDFAFHVHTTLGLSFKGAKVNGNIVPIDHILENGDIIEILKHPDPRPSPQWITLLRTASARSRLKHYLHSQERPMHLAIGRDALNEELQKHHLPLLDTDLSLLRLVDHESRTMSEREDLLVRIGQGMQNVSSFLPHLTLLKDRLQERPQRPAVFVRGTSLIAKVDGNIPMPVLFAKCCKPDSSEGSPVIGVISRTGDIRVHLTGCKMLKNVNPARKIGVKWTNRAEALKSENRNPKPE